MYIRTKDGAIYDLKSKEISSIEQKDCWVNIFYYNREKGQYLEWDDNGGRSMDTIYKTEIIKESENLEELCDEFVLYDNQLKTFGVFDKKVITFKWLQNNLEIYKGMIIYGAIWTEWGLKYVAKMDREGKLVLI